LWILSVEFPSASLLAEVPRSKNLSDLTSWKAPEIGALLSPLWLVLSQVFFAFADTLPIKGGLPMSIPLPKLLVGNPIQHRAISVFPLFAEAFAPVNYILSEDAISSSSVVVQEVGEHGTVPELLVENKGDSRVLFLEGELLTGAKQDRVLNTTILVPIATQIKIPVICVEQGRWSYRSRSFTSSREYSSASLRYVMRESVSASSRAHDGHRSDQGAVWDEVAKQQRALGVDSETSAMADSFTDFQGEVKRYQEKLEYPKEAAGPAVAVGSKLLSVDLFDKPSTCEKV
jgi:hypothetical protein